MIIYLWTALIFALAALLGAVDAASTSFNLFPWFTGLRWLRVHLITLGMMTQILFGLLPYLTAARAGKPEPKSRLDIWLTLNGGILFLLVGIPLLNNLLITIGGSLVFIATTLLALQLWGLRATAVNAATISWKFYIAGLLYFLFGIFVGTGMWQGWNELIGMKVPIEVHIHANNWGLMSLVFAGLLIDLYPKFAGRPLAKPDSVNRIFLLMSIGAFGLVLGPWFGSKWILVPGLLMHLTATVMLMYNIIQPLKGNPALQKPGIWHIVTSYVWIFAPVLVAPFILFGVPGFPGAGIEANAPQALVYGWLLQFGYALFPFVFARYLTKDEEPELGGSWLSLITVHLGGIFLWLSIFYEQYQNSLHGTAYLMWAISLVPILRQLWRLARAGWDGMVAEKRAVYKKKLLPQAALIVAALVAILFIQFGTDQGSEQLAAAGAPQGEQLFSQTCQACHGVGGVGIDGLGKDMTSSEFIQGMDDQQLLEFIKNGRSVNDPLNSSGIEMPAKGGNPSLTDAELLEIISYIRSLSE